MKHASCRLVFLIACLAWAKAGAHSRQVSPAPRNSNAGLKTPPCGGIPPGADPSAYQVLELGKTYQMTLEETIQHPGKFIYNLLDRNGAKMADLVTVTDDINRGRKTVSVPLDAAKGAAVCNDCILQLIQRMEENPANPTFYYSCADVKIVAAGTNAPPLAAVPLSDPAVPQEPAAQCVDH
jgi:hypothetical protein